MPISNHSDRPTFWYEELRPNKFGDVQIDRERFRRALAIIMSNPKPVVVILSGPSGGGKSTLAKLLISGYFCTHPNPESRPCRETGCTGCDGFKSFTNVDDFNNATDRNWTADGIAERIQQVRFSSANPALFIDEAHNLNDRAQELLLHFTENLSPRTIVILATTEPDRLKGSLKSRAINFSLAPLTTQQIIVIMNRVCDTKNVFLHLETRKRLIDLIANVCDGNARTAIKHLEEAHNLYSEMPDIDSLQHLYLGEDFFTVSHILSRKGSRDINPEWILGYLRNISNMRLLNVVVNSILVSILSGNAVVEELKAVVNNYSPNEVLSFYQSFNALKLSAADIKSRLAIEFHRLIIGACHV